MSWAATAAAVAGGVGGYMNSALNNSKGGQEGQTVYNFNDPQDLAMRQQSQAYMSNVLNGLQSGQAPAWLNNYLNPEQSYLMQQNQQQMFGLPGQSGGSIADIAQSQGAAMGLGGAAAMAPTNDALSQYAQRMNGINQYISGIKSNYMTQASNNVPTALYNTAKQNNQIANNTIPGTPNSAPQFNFGGAAPMIQQGLQGMFQPGVNYVPSQTNSTVPTSSDPNVSVSSNYSQY